MAAVEAFFFISGFYMAAAYPRYQGRFAAVSFWLSRYCRLLPFYATVLACTYLCWLAGLPNNTTAIFNAFGQGDAPWLAIVTLLGQDIISVNERTHLMLPVRQSWSISAELVFYALVPLLLKFRSHWLLVLALLPFALKAYFTLSGDWRSAYFPFYSQLGYFMLGVLLFRFRQELTWQKPFAVPLIALASLYLVTSNFAAFELNGLLANAGMVLAVAIAMPTAFRHSNGPMSNFLGDISYGVYLVHVLVIELLISSGWIAYGAPASASVIWTCVLVLGFSVLAAALFEVAIQDPIDRWRRKSFYGESSDSPGEQPAVP